MKNELCHYNTKDSHWYVNGPGKRWQSHAQYAMGTPNPDGQTKSNDLVDKRTGFKLKNGETSVESDMHFTNPHRNNPNDPMNNCVACTATYEMRRRGYNVSVKNDEQRDKTASHYRLHEYFPKADVYDCGAVTPNQIRKVAAKARVGSNTRLVREVNRLLLSQGNGARGAIGTLYTTRSGMVMGHEMAYEVKKNKLHIYDSQSGYEVNTHDSLRYCVGAYCTRLDDVDFDVKKMKGVCK